MRQLEGMKKFLEWKTSKSSQGLFLKVLKHFI